VVLDPAEISVAVVTALPVECAAVRALADDVADQPAPDSDPNYYASGLFPGPVPQRPHRAVIAVLPFDGTRTAAAVVSDLLRSFPSVQAVIMSGIAAGVPQPADPERHVRLGDIVVATSLVATDQVRLTDGAESLRWQPGGVPYELLRAVRELQIKSVAGARPWETWLVSGADPALEPFARPDDATDVLHVRGGPVEHPPRELSGHRPGLPKVHYGPIASGDQLMKDEARRDELAARHQVLAFEMEATGISVAAALRGRQTLVVRGISDYGDRMKDGRWQAYAALAAAAYVRALLAECREFSSARGGGRADDTANGRAGAGAGRTVLAPPVPPWPVLVELADLLLEIPLVADDQGRQALIEQLRPAIRGALRRNRAMRLEVIEMVRLIFNYVDGPQEFMAALSRLDGGTVPAARFATAIQAALPPGSVSSAHQLSGPDARATRAGFYDPPALPG
jgi:nucleoside phosphorylase